MEVEDKEYTIWQKILGNVLFVVISSAILTITYLVIEYGEK